MLNAGPSVGLLGLDARKWNPGLTFESFEITSMTEARKITNLNHLSSIMTFVMVCVVDDEFVDFEF